MTGCGCDSPSPTSEIQRRILFIALGLNTAMFCVGLVAGVVGQSSGLLADALDMLADATAYAIAIAALRRGAIFKARAAAFSGTILLILGASVLLDVLRRGLTGSDPESLLMIAVASVSLAVNAIVLGMLRKVRGEGVHLSASWIFTRADVIANIGVISSGVIVAVTGFRFVDLFAGTGIGLYVIKEALEILGEAREARAKATA